MRSWQIRLGVVLISLSVCGYLIHYIIFQDIRAIFFYLIGNLAFVFINVLLVTLIIQSLLVRSDRANKLLKLDTLIGIFFTELGTWLVWKISSLDKRMELMQYLKPSYEWGSKDYRFAIAKLREKGLDIQITTKDLIEIKSALAGKRDFIMGLLENQNLVEHQEFTQLLLAVFHVSDELNYRPDLDVLPQSDIDHLIKDLERAYPLLVREWLRYLDHLRVDHPYLYSLAIRTNPMDPDASAIIKE